MADHRARAAEQEVEPLPPGVDPLEAIDPELRELVVSLDPVAEVDGGGQGPTSGERLGSAAAGAALFGLVGAMAVNGFGRRYGRYHLARQPMDVGMTLAVAGLAAAVGGIAGFARGGDPLGDGPAPRIPGATAGVAPLPASASYSPAHPAFAALYG